MSMTLRAIETLYRGYRFRSRLEARWAAFFHLLGWQAHYEPFDLNGWIPDFILHGSKQRVPVEVKPIASEDDPIFWETVRKIAASGWRGDALIVGYLLPREGQLCVGWLGEDMTGLGGTCGDPDPARCWATAPFQIVGDGCMAVAGFCHEYQSYHDRISGDHPGGQTGASNEELIESLWAQAANEVQWRGE
jgi:hypothetical protein